MLPQNRILLSDLETCEFVQAYPSEQPAFVDPGKELLIPEEGVLNILESVYGFSPKKVAESVKGYCLDRYRVHYYLVLNQQMAGGQSLLGAERLCKYKKQRKSSASKL